jgi:hypothetical protein
MAIEECAWAVCICISYTGDGGQLGCSLLWSGRGGWVGQGNCRKSYTDSVISVRTQAVLKASRLAKRSEINTGANVLWNKPAATF